MTRRRFLMKYLVGNRYKGCERDVEYYDKVYANNFSHDTDSEEVYGIIARKIPADKLIIDIGCGDGHLLNYLEGCEDRYIGLDFSEKAIELAYNSHRNNTFIVADLYKSSALINEYCGGDCILIAIEFFEHVKARKIIKKLKKGVPILGSVPSFADYAHERTYSYDNIANELGIIIDNKAKVPLSFKEKKSRLAPKDAYLTVFEGRIK
jgi:SAM-dependent methyltransferase